MTVVIPCYNQARFLAESVRSARAQTVPPVECIVVDDGSTDDTGKVAGGLDVRLIRQANRGVSAARNAGLAAASGDFIVFLDADDVLFPDALARGADALVSRPDLAAVVTRCDAMTEDGAALPARQHDIDPSNLYREWLSRNFVWTPGAAMFRRDALAQSGGFATDFGPAADYAIYLRLARQGRVALIPGASVRYRQHAASMSRDPMLMLRATLRALERESREAPAWARGDIRRGRRTWCKWYGEQMVHELRTAWHAGTWNARHAKSALVLARTCPRLVLRHLLRKTRRSVGKRRRSPSSTTPRAGQ